MNYKPYSSKEGQEVAKWLRNSDSTDRARIIREFLKGITRPKYYPEKGKDCSHCCRNEVLAFLMKKHNVDNPQKVLEKFLIAKKNGEAFDF
jgi:hypothetical protein